MHAHALAMFHLRVHELASVCLNGSVGASMHVGIYIYIYIYIYILLFPQSEGGPQTYAQNKMFVLDVATS